jgi:hypothetical protein
MHEIYFGFRLELFNSCWRMGATDSCDFLESVSGCLSAVRIFTSWLGEAIGMSFWEDSFFDLPDLTDFKESYKWRNLLTLDSFLTLTRHFIIAVPNNCCLLFEGLKSNISSSSLKLNVLELSKLLVSSVFINYYPNSDFHFLPIDNL